METWTREELESRSPFGSVNIVVDDDVRLMTFEEWDAWIERGVGDEKLVDPLDSVLRLPDTPETN